MLQCHLWLFEATSTWTLIAHQPHVYANSDPARRAGRFAGHLDALLTSSFFPNDIAVLCINGHPLALRP